MSLVRLTIDRLRTQCPQLKDVLPASDLAAIKEQPPLRFPTAYVLAVRESGSGNRYMTGAVAQRRQMTVAIMLLVKNVRDARGGAATTDMDALRILVDDALFGWLPSQEYEPLVFQRGSLMQMHGGELWWQDEYTTEYDRRK